MRNLEIVFSKSREQYVEVRHDGSGWKGEPTAPMYTLPCTDGKTPQIESRHLRFRHPEIPDARNSTQPQADTDLDGAWEMLLKNPAKTQRSGAKAALSWSLIKIPSRKIVLCLCCRSALPCFLLLADMKAEAVQTLQLRPDILNRKMESCPDTIRLRSCQFFDNSGRKPGQFLSGDTVAL